MTLLAWIALPYDQGFPHVLHVGEETAIISAWVATCLNAQGIPEGNEGTVGSPLPTLNLDGLPLSAKARRLLTLKK